jgi:hypothetical protein
MSRRANVLVERKLERVRLRIELVGDDRWRARRGLFRGRSSGRCAGLDRWMFVPSFARIERTARDPMAHGVRRFGAPPPSRDDARLIRNIFFATAL